MTAGLQGKVVLITGASKGIGKAIALAMATEGARLALCARDEDQLKLAANEIQVHTKADVLSVKANMTKLNDISRFVNVAVKKFNRIDILVNNAGGAHIGGILNTTDEDWEYHIQLKLLGYMRMAREVIPHMKTNGGGKIINIVGTAGKEPNVLFMVPGVTNGALLNFTKSLSKELEGDSISVNAVNPGTTNTPLTEETFKSLATILQKTQEEVRESAVNLSPRGRIASPEDVAKVVLFLASDASNLINGISINADDGKVLGV
ncbi:MAG: SDR family oxidoreductase [Ignavibacteria bacterium]|nr:SDR family oxidoreductase [Ignavibacteria bacterium]MBI3765779.1 SDR family oxidoreductase [Ignavibacteriales bacterium]